MPAAVPGPDIEIQHGVDTRAHGARLNVVGRHQETVVAIHSMLVRVARMHHQGTHHTHRHLHHFVRVRVIHKSARLLQFELVGVSLAGRDLRLVETTHAVHAGGQKNAMPVYGGVFRQAVGDEYAHLVAFHALDGRPWRLAVVTPQPRHHARRDLALDRFRGQVKLLPAVFHPPGQ
jgi:hypothetical protein